MSNPTEEYNKLWAKVLKAADACNVAPWHGKIAAMERYTAACKAASIARAKLPQPR